MENLERDYRPLLLARHEPPCLSLYMPTDRSFPQRRQNVVRFRNLLRELENSLERTYHWRQTTPLLQPFHDLAADEPFWKHPRDGLAVFATTEVFRVYRLQRPVRELAIVADSFHTKPLARILQSADHYHILGLSRGEARLFAGNRYALDEVDLPASFPRGQADVIDLHGGGPERAGRTYGPSGPGTTHHGTDQRQQDLDAATERFFRAVDEAVQALTSREGGAPLFLMALPENQHRFRSLSRNPSLMEQGIDTDPGAVAVDALRDDAWALMLPHYLARLDGIIETFGAARANGTASADAADIARAATGGRVATLLVEADREVPGRIDERTGAIIFGPLDDPQTDDLLDDIAEQVLGAGGEVIAVPADRMPVESGIAAIFRH